MPSILCKDALNIPSFKIASEDSEENDQPELFSVICNVIFVMTIYILLEKTKYFCNTTSAGWDIA